MSHECICGRPLGGDSICSNCAQTLQVALGNISSYWRDLDTVRARQTRYGDAGGRTGAEKALPVDLRFLDWDGDGSRLVEAVRLTVVTWTRVVLEERPITEGPTHPACLHVSCSRLNRSRPPADNIPACCVYLLGHADWVRTQHWAPEILDELLDVERQLRRLVDRPRERIYAGPCRECNGDMYGRPGAAKVDCRPCGLEYDVAEMVDWMRSRVYGRLVTAREAVMLLGRFGLSVQQKTIDKWVERKRLSVHSHDNDGVRLYLFDELMELAAASATAGRKGAA